MRHNARPKKNKHGFSLAEAVVACCILVLLAGGIGSAVAFAVSGTAEKIGQADISVRERELLCEVIAVMSSASYNDTDNEENLKAIFHTVGFDSEVWQGYQLKIEKSDNGGFLITLITPENEMLTAYASDTGGAFYAD